MAWTRTWVINDIPLTFTAIGPFMVGFELQDETVVQLLANRDPRILDALAQANRDMVDIKLAGDVSCESAFDWRYAIYEPGFDLDGFIANMRRIVERNPYANEHDKAAALDRLSCALAEKAERAARPFKRELIKSRRLEFGGKRAQLLLALIDRDGYVCQECGCSEGLEVDHIIPLSRGGGDDLNNLQLLCKPCNSRKQDKMPEMAGEQDVQPAD